jgi:hypothetical protein
VFGGGAARGETGDLAVGAKQPHRKNRRKRVAKRAPVVVGDEVRDEKEMGR